MLLQSFLLVRPPSLLCLLGKLLIGFRLFVFPLLSQQLGEANVLLKLCDPARFLLLLLSA